MEAEDIKRLRPVLSEFLGRFSDCLENESHRAHFEAYINGQFSDLERKNVEAIANEQRVNPRTLQEFLTNYEWDHARVRQRVAEIVAGDFSETGGRGSIGIIDETSFVKKGDKTPGVQRQHCGAVGKQENCIVTVHLAYARPGFQCLLDGELFLPQSWSDDRPRCQEAGIPDDVVYRPKSEIALELYRRAVENGIDFEWLTFDEWYGAKPAFLGALVAHGQKYVGEVHKNHVVWFSRPQVTNREYRRNGRGRSRPTPRVTKNSPRATHIQTGMRRDQALRQQPWERWHLKDTEKGPKVVEIKTTVVYPKGEDGLPMPAHHLLIVRDVLAPDDVKLFLAYVPERNKFTSQDTETHLKVSFSRWQVERCFEDDKGRIGLDHYEGRRYQGLIRHLIISSVSLVFLARIRSMLGVGLAELTVRQLRMAVNALIQSLTLPPPAGKIVIEKAAHIIQYHQRRNATARKSHTKTRNSKLEALGIDISRINRCNWNTS